MEICFLDWLQTLHHPILDAVMVGISTIGNAGLVWIVLAVVLLLRKQTRPLGTVLAVALLLDVVLCNLWLKNWVARIRPYEVGTAVRLLVEKPSDYSFPSGHTAAAFAVVAGMWFYGERGRLIWAAALLACLMAFSRMYLYVHYPTDILGGMLVGIVAGYVSVIINKKKCKTRILKLHKKIKKDDEKL